MADIFKAYDIRGLYPGELNEDVVYKVGRALVGHLGAMRIAMGEDNRASSPSLSHAFAKGVTDAGADIVRLGMLSTPMLYFASAHLDVDAAAMITASHNPPEYNGIKLCLRNAVPMGLSSGLSDLRTIIEKNEWSEPSRLGLFDAQDIKPEYDKFISSFADLRGKRFRIATDTAHAMGVLELPLLRSLRGVCLCSTLYDTLRKDGEGCPHEANPLNQSTLTELAHAVHTLSADMGIAFDGDADRIGFVDDLGVPVPMDLITAILAEALIADHPNMTVLYDLRSSRVVKERVEALGGTAIECKVGHANIKRHMIERGALLAGEASGHYYFSLGSYTAEMGSLPAILIMNHMAKTGKKLSELVRELRKYHHTGELNFRVSDARSVFAKTRERYADAAVTEIDGIKISYPDWWFSLRSSNTEPLVRLNLEADTSELMEEKKSEIIALLRA